MSRTDERIGVVLLQLGGPDRLESVEPFLRNLFSDPDIIDLPLAFLFRETLARIIADRRAPKVVGIYRRIGNRSPIVKLTLRQAAALERALRPVIDARVFVAMRYWHPMTEEAIAAVLRERISRIVLLPLYPQYSKSTTGSSIHEWKRVAAQLGVDGVPTSVVREYCEHPLYIQAMIRNIGFALNRVKRAERELVHLVFTAHGTPLRLVRKGDPYRDQIVRTFNAIVAAGQFGIPHHLCFQSKVGPQRWLEPSLIQTIDRLAREKVSHMIAVPIAFVSDHSETLFEINMEAREQARRAGIRHFDISPALNGSPLFIGALADLVLRQVRQ